MMQDEAGCDIAHPSRPKTADNAADPSDPITEKALTECHSACYKRSVVTAKCRRHGGI
jgi:hypothetical protein